MTMRLCLLIFLLGICHVNLAFAYQFPRPTPPNETYPPINGSLNVQYLANSHCDKQDGSDIARSRSYIINYLIDPQKFVIDLTWNMLSYGRDTLDICYSYPFINVEKCYENLDSLNATAAEDVHNILDAVTQINVSIAFSQRLLQSIICTTCSNYSFYPNSDTPQAVFDMAKKRPTDKIEKALEFATKARFPYHSTSASLALLDPRVWSAFADTTKFYKPVALDLMLQRVIKPANIDIFYVYNILPMELMPVPRPVDDFLNCWNIQEVVQPLNYSFSSFDYNRLYAFSKYAHYVSFNASRVNDDPISQEDFVTKCIDSPASYAKGYKLLDKIFLFKQSFFNPFLSPPPGSNFYWINLLGTLARFSPFSNETLDHVIDLQHTITPYYAALETTQKYIFCRMVYDGRVDLGMSLDGSESAKTIDAIFPTFLSQLALVVHDFKGKLEPKTPLNYRPQLALSFGTISYIVGTNATLQEIHNYLNTTLTPAKYDLTAIYAYFYTLGYPNSLENAYNGLKPHIANVWGIGSDYMVGKNNITTMPLTFTTTMLERHRELSLRAIIAIVLSLLLLTIALVITLLSCVKWKPAKKSYALLEA